MERSSPDPREAPSSSRFKDASTGTHPPKDGLPFLMIRVKAAAVSSAFARWQTVLSVAGATGKAAFRSQKKHDPQGAR